MQRRIAKPTPNHGKIVKLSESNDQGEKDYNYPIFCFKHVHSSHGLGACSKDEQAALIKTIFKLSQLDWNTIQLSNRHGVGSEKINIQSIKPSIPAFITSDVTHLLAFRFKGLAPFVGHRRGSVFHVLYIDRDFTLYKHSS